MVYFDPETEPESTDTPCGLAGLQGSNRPDDIKKYLLDQATGYRESLKIIDSLNPDFISIVGDDIEAEGQQRD